MLTDKVCGNYNEHSNAALKPNELRTMYICRTLFLVDVVACTYSGLTDLALEITSIYTKV